MNAFVFIEIGLAWIVKRCVFFSGTICVCTVASVSFGYNYGCFNFCVMIVSCMMVVLVTASAIGGIITRWMEYSMVSFRATVNSKTNLLLPLFYCIRIWGASKTWPVFFCKFQMIIVGCVQIFYGSDYKASATCSLSDC